MLRSVLQRTEAAWLRWESRVVEQRALNDAVRAAETALRGIREEAEVGQRTVADLLDAQRDLVNAQVRYAGNERELVVAAYSLLREIGQLTAEKLQLEVELYEPRRHRRGGVLVP